MKNLIREVGRGTVKAVGSLALLGALAGILASCDRKDNIEDLFRKSNVCTVQYVDSRDNSRTTITGDDSIDLVVIDYENGTKKVLNRQTEANFEFDSIKIDSNGQVVGQEPEDVSQYQNFFNYKKRNQCPYLN